MSRGVTFSRVRGCAIALRTAALLSTRDTPHGGSRPDLAGRGVGERQDRRVAPAGHDPLCVGLIPQPPPVPGKC